MFNLLNQNLPFVAFFPTLVFLCVRLNTCSVHKRSSAICSRLPPENILLAIVFLLISLRVLIQWAVIAAGNERYLERLRSATFPSLYWTYGALLYLLPAVEFFIEVALFPGFKNAKAWFGFVCDLLSGPLAATSVRLSEETLIQLTIAVYLIIFVVYTFVFYHQRYHAFQFSWFVFELVLLFCLLVIEQVSVEFVAKFSKIKFLKFFFGLQFLLINPVSLVITVIVFVVWNALKLPPTGYFDADSATIELETFQSFTCLTTKL